MKRYLLATRPWSFPVSVAPVLLTSLYLFAVCPETISAWPIALWTLVSMMLFHAASNLWSDFFDYRKGVDTDPSIGSPTITGGLLTDRQTLIYASVLLVISLLNGLALMFVTECWPLFIFGAVGALLIVLYPFFKFHALGDLDILLTFGILPTLGTAYVLTGELLWSSLWITPAFATITVAVLHANNTRDTTRDSRAGIHTFAMLIGPKACQWVYYAEIWLPLIWMVVCFVAGWGGFAWPCLAAVVLAGFLARRNTTVMASLTRGGNIDTLDQFTAQHQLLNTLLLSLALVAQILFF